ncbi:MAG: hypothetical protein HYU36_10875 [Planctomycetes bacterium]|nr:hypothetical protein [Planctomycetota bacterium]
MFLAVLPALCADPFSPAVSWEDLDPDVCSALRNDEGRWERAQEQVLKDVLGLQPGRGGVQKAWAIPGGLVDAEPGRLIEFHFRICFKRPVAIGSALLPTGSLRYLKDDTAYPGDPSVEDRWGKAEGWPGQSGGLWLTFPPGVKTRAVLVTLLWSGERGGVRLSDLHLFRDRLLNVAPAACVQAGAEYVPPPARAGVRPPPHRASFLTTGTGPPWQNTGKDESGVVRRSDISVSSPEWIVMSWMDAQEIVGIRAKGDFGRFELQGFAGEADVPPAVGTPDEWQRVALHEGGTKPLSFTPLRAAGIRLLFTRGGEIPAIVSLEGLQVYTDLGDRPMSAFERSEGAHPPILVDYEIPEDGLAAMVIDDSRGRRVRNLFALENRSAGRHRAAWDAKDMEGAYVSPGNYRWRVLSGKPLELHYQFTVYPSLGEGTPWPTGETGAGGWLSDHAPACAAATWGDCIWFGAPVSESGVSLMECDLSGRKRAGWPNFDRFTGARYLAADGQEVYIATPGQGRDNVWAYSPEKRTVRQVLSQPSTAARRSGVTGLAAWPKGAGEEGSWLYLSFQAQADWLARAFEATSADSERCLPYYPPSSPSRATGRVVSDHRGDFLRLFRLTGSPPGSRGSLTWIETAEESGVRHHIVLAFKKALPVGTAVFSPPELPKGWKFRLSFLKPETAYPPKPADDSAWTFLEDSGQGFWDAVPFPPATSTRAIRLTWERPDADPLGDVEESFSDAPGDVEEGGDGLEAGQAGRAEKKAQSGPKWKAELEGMTFLRRRFENLGRTAQVRVNSGILGEKGEWRADATNVVSPSHPGIYLLEWKSPVSLRGLAIREVDGENTEIDVFIGSEKDEVSLEGQEHWRMVATYRQARRDYTVPSATWNGDARYLDATVDFGQEVVTRAVRLRITQAFTSHPTLGVRRDRGGQEADPRRCGVQGVAPLAYLGGEAPLDGRETERIGLYDSRNGTLEKEIPVERPGCIQLDASGRLYALSGSRLIRVNPEARGASDHGTVVENLPDASALAIDRLGRFYIFDASPESQVVRVFDPDGRPLHSIGRPGGRKAGPWDRGAFKNVTALAVDAEDHLWVVEYAFHPKRISKWTLDGRFLAEFLGPAEYGGGGILDPRDPSRFYYKAMEFELDWERGTSRLKNLIWTDATPPGEIPIEYHQRRYMVTRTRFGIQSVGLVYLYEENHLKLAAGVGNAADFAPLAGPGMLEALGGVRLQDHRFTWSDLNGDGEVQPAEVVLRKIERSPFFVGRFNADLSLMAGSILFRVKEILPHGAPVWEEVPFPALEPFAASSLQLEWLPGDNFFVRGAWNGVVTAQAELLWRYPTLGSGVQALHSAPPYTPGQVVAEFENICHPDSMNAPAGGELGAFQIHSSNPAAWNIWTHDGILAGTVFRDYRIPDTAWWGMEDHQRGLRLDTCSPGGEHFRGYFCQASGGRCYIVAGHNHASLVEVKGLDSFRRSQGSVSVTEAVLQRARAWETEQARRKNWREAPILFLHPFSTSPKIDGDDDDWFGVPVARIPRGDPLAAPTASFRITYDRERLYLFYRVNRGPLRNDAEDWRRIFKTGSSVDLQLATDPGLTRARHAPAAGDLRLLITVASGKPLAVLYRPVSPGHDPAAVYEVVSPVGREVIEEVRRLDDAEVAIQEQGPGYQLEAALPLKTLGFKPEPGRRYRFDWGILTTDEHGHTVTGRYYWSNETTPIISDAPSEVRMTPNLWGHLLAAESSISGPEDIRSLSPLDEGKIGGGESPNIEDDLEESQEPEPVKRPKPRTQDRPRR